MDVTFQPQSRRQSERLITRVQGNLDGAPSFGEVFDDLANPPSNGLKYSENYHVYPDWLEPRGGSKLWSATTLPALVGRTGYSLTKSGSTVTATVGANFTSADIGNYIVYDDGAHERITACGSTTVVTVEDSTAHAASTAAWVRGPVYMLAHHEGKNKVVLQIDTRLFVAASTTITSWIPSFNVRNYYELGASLSEYDELGDFLVIFNAAGIFKLDLSATGSVTDPYHYWMMNSRCPSVLINTTATSTYQYRYLYSMARIAGTSLIRNRTDSQVLQQSGTPERSATTNLDYGTICSTTAIAANAGLVVGATPSLGMMCVPTVPAIGYRIAGWTHYSLYRTLDIGANGKDAQNGVVNNKELFIWVADIPVAKCWMATRHADDWVLSVEDGTFSQDDVGAAIVFLGGATTTIVSVDPDTHIPTVADGGALTSRPCAIGGGSLALAKQEVLGTETIGRATVTLTVGGSTFAATDVGKTIFWPDGPASVIVKYLTTTTVEVDNNAQITNTACTWNAVARLYTDITDDTTLRARIAGFSLPNRYFGPMLNCNTGAVAGAFLFGAVKDTSSYHYSQIPDDMEYYGGYYNEAYQVDLLQGAIQKLRRFEDRVVAYCKSSTFYIPTNSYGKKIIPQIGEVVIIVIGHYELSGELGVNSGTSVVRVSAGRDLVINADGGMRYCDGSKYSDNLAENRFSKRLTKIQAPVSAFYHTLSGFLLWCSNVVNSHASLNNNANACYRYAITAQQGVGFCEYTGDAWVIPEIGTGVVAVTDSQGFSYVLVLDRKSGLFYHISTRPGPTGGTLARIAKDKAIADGTGGTDIVPSVTLPGERGTYEHYFVEHKESHIYARPYDAASGFPAGLTFQFDIYKDGETTAAATSVAVPRAGDITYDRKVEGHQLSTKITANMGDHLITGRQQYYVAKDIAATPTNRTMSERTYQRTLGLPTLWLGIRNGVLINRVTGAEITGTYTVGTGPDLKTNSAVSISAPLTLPSVTLATTGALLIWHNGTIAVTIGGDAVALTSHGAAVEGFTLSYAAGLTKSGAVVITPTGTALVSDLRIFTTAIDAATRTYLYDDVDDNGGNAVMVRN